MNSVFFFFPKVFRAIFWLRWCRNMWWRRKFDSRSIWVGSSIKNDVMHLYFDKLKQSQPADDIINTKYFNNSRKIYSGFSTCEYGINNFKKQFQKTITKSNPKSVQQITLSQTVNVGS